MSACEWSFSNVIKRERTQKNECCVYLNQSFLQAFALIRDRLQSLLGVSHDFIIKRATLSLVFLSGNKRQRYFTSHLIPGLWKQSPFEVAVVWMCHWKLIRYSWLEVENVLWPWYQGFSYAALSFCQKNLQVERGLFCLQIIHFLAATNLALPSLQALLIMVYLKSTWKLVSTFRNQRIPAWQLSNICVVLLHCFTLACQLLPV